MGGEEVDSPPHSLTPVHKCSPLPICPHTLYHNTRKSLSLGKIHLSLAQARLECPPS